MKQYEALELEIVFFPMEDVIITSSQGDITLPPFGG